MTARTSVTGPSYRGQEMKTQLDWSAWPGAGGGFQGAVEMCNNNGACRKIEGGAMCPSYRVTREERDVTRGRANSLRLAITGQLGPDALTSDEMAETLKLCVSCKACRRECPTGVDMARMKIEVLSARAAKHGLSLRDRLIGYLPRYAPHAAKFPALANARDKYPWLKALSERLAGLSGRRTLPQWRADMFDDTLASLPHLPGHVGEGANDNEPREVVLLADTFNRYFERENLDAAVTVLHAAGYKVHVAKPVDGVKRPLCCGRTFLSVGRVDQARREAERVIAAVEPFVKRGVPVIGLEPSCILGFRDEVPAMIKSEACAAAFDACADVRGVSGARGRGRPAQPAAQAAGQARTRPRPLPPEIVRHDGRGRAHPEARPESQGRDRRTRAAAGWRARSATAPTRSMCRLRWANFRCCPRCARPTPTRSSWRTAPPAGTRSTMARSARRCTSRACWR